MRRLLLGVLLAASVTACESAIMEDDVEATAVAAEDDGCPNQARVVGNDKGILGEPATADVDGDGHADSVYLQNAEGAEQGCAAFVVARLARNRDGELVSEPVWEIGREGGLPQPRINSVAQIDGSGGVEILVDEIAGASTQFVGAFALVDGVLERLEPADPLTDLWAGASQGVFPYGGSVGHVEAVDCTEPGEIVVSSALPGDTPKKVDRGIYTVTRRFFEIRGAELTETDSEEEEVRFEFGKTYPEFGSSPFGSCPSA